MIRRGTVPDERLDRMVRAIVESVQPTRIVLYGSRARGDERPDSDYDLLVEVDHEEGYDGYYGRVHEIRCALQPLDVSVDVTVHRPGQLENQRDDPGRMAWDIAREGIIVYPADADSKVLRPVATRDRVRESEPPASIQDWLARAQEDLDMIEQSLAAKPVWGGIAFHSQQAAEKYLKAVLIRGFIRPPRTHELAELVAAVRAAGFEFPDVAAECALLQPYAIDVRYPEKVPIPDDAKGRLVLEAGRRIVDAAKRYL